MQQALVGQPRVEAGARRGRRGSSRPRRCSSPRPSTARVIACASAPTFPPARLRRDDRIGRGRAVHRPEGRLKVQRHPELLRLPAAVPAAGRPAATGMPFGQRLPARARERASRGRAACRRSWRRGAPRSPPAGCRRGRPRARRCAEVVVDLHAGRPPCARLRCSKDPSRVISGVNVTNPSRGRGATGPSRGTPDMPAMTEPKLISGNANLPLAKSIARRMSMHRGMSVEPGRCAGRTVQRPGDLRRGVRERPRRGHVHHPADVEPGQRQPDGACSS